jgi:hypothetical protein
MVSRPEASRPTPVEAGDPAMSRDMVLLQFRALQPELWDHDEKRLRTFLARARSGGPARLLLRTGGGEAGSKAKQKALAARRAQTLLRAALLSGFARSDVVIEKPTPDGSAACEPATLCDNPVHAQVKVLRRPLK